eukprot:2275738-Pyramimonas_sp.AAC.1
MQRGMRLSSVRLGIRVIDTVTCARDASHREHPGASCTNFAAGSYATSLFLIAQGGHSHLR